jgi:hypothetical protein
MEDKTTSPRTWNELVAHQEALRRLKGMMEVLTNDIEEFADMAIVPNQIIPFSSMRAYVRAVFALVEGVSFGFRQIALKAPLADYCLTQGELAVMNEESYGLKDNGEVSISSRFLKVQAGTRFTFAICKRVYEIQTEINYGDSGWDSFIKAIKIRDRLMHPKSVECLDVTDDELGIVSDALKWFLDAVKNTMDGMHAHLKKKAPFREASS